jgi:heme-degrading monooxygenase HmoA
MTEVSRSEGRNSSEVHVRMDSEYAYIWEYVVRPEEVSEFERAYGPEGSWAELFRRHPGYLRTELHRDLRRPARYVTIDYWQSREACRAFRREFARAFESLDKRCDLLTETETYLGEFSPVR